MLAFPRTITVLALCMLGGTPAWSGSLTAGGNHVGENHSNEIHSGESLDGIVLTSSNLRNTDFSTTSFIGADFSSSNMRDAILTGANLDGANFAGSQIRDADFSGASLLGADLSTATNWNRAIWTGATYDATTLFAPGMDPVAVGMILVSEASQGLMLITGLSGLYWFPRRGRDDSQRAPGIGAS